MTTLYQEARAALGNSDFKPKKRLGQNFLIHEPVIESILRLLDLSAEDEVVEIGPGLGFLTRRLTETACRVWAVEIDPFLAHSLRQSALGSDPAFHLVEGDVLKIDLDALLPARKVKLVANLPYSIATAVLFRIFEWRNHFSSLVLMVQREVAERIASGPGTKAYGTLSIWCRVHGRILDKVAVSPEAFFPRPKVRSTILKIGLYPAPLVPAEDMPFLRALLRAAFGQRRKTLANALGGGLKRPREEIEEFLRAEGVDPKRRGETLSVEEHIRLARALNRLGAPGLEG